jgi:hypothetical protein
MDQGALTRRNRPAALRRLRRAVLGRLPQAAYPEPVYGRQAKPDGRLVEPGAPAQKPGYGQAVRPMGEKPFSGKRHWQSLARAASMGKRSASSSLGSHHVLWDISSFGVKGSGEAIRPW